LVPTEIKRRLLGQLSPVFRAKKLVETNTRVPETETMQRTEMDQVFRLQSETGQSPPFCFVRSFLGKSKKPNSVGANTLHDQVVNLV
jgi:hypothetical protein